MRVQIRLPHFPLYNLVELQSEVPSSKPTAPNQKNHCLPLLWTAAFNRGGNVTIIYSLEVPLVVSVPKSVLVAECSIRYSHHFIPASQPPDPNPSESSSCFYSPGRCRTKNNVISIPNPTLLTLLFAFFSFSCSNTSLSR